ncbi:MAG: hypothetical protein DRP97_02715 [Candidatus Latescibacterota bacterium]|nr:MAG: hypothetical protein DRP97_02715 [Candidatus Latescibacterota bacterium]
MLTFGLGFVSGFFGRPLGRLPKRLDGKCGKNRTYHLDERKNFLDKKLLALVKTGIMIATIRINRILKIIASSRERIGRGEHSTGSHIVPRLFCPGAFDGDRP